MSECDAYKLIEEFIKKSSDNTTNLNNTSNFDTMPPTLLSITTTETSSSSSSSFISSYLDVNKYHADILETPPETPEQSKPIQLPYKLDTPTQKPNRPYSYYVATNFHPLDLSELTQETDLESSKLEYTIHEQPIKRRKNTKKIDEKKRLSMSLTDIQINKHDKIEHPKKTYSFFRLSKKSKSNQNNFAETDFEETDDDTFMKSSTSAFKRSFIFNSTMPARLNSRRQTNQNSQSQHQHGKINRFFRNLFRMNEKPVKEDELETSQTNFKFSRLFSFRHNDKSVRYKYSVPSGVKTRESVSASYRSNSTSTNDTACPLQLVVTDEQPSKLILPQISLEHEVISEQHSPDSCDLNEITQSFNKMSSFDNLDILKEKFYSEVAERLKKIASCTNSSANFSNEKSSLSSIDLIDIPYIDDEDESLDENLYSYTTSDMNFSQTSSNKLSIIKTDMSDLFIDANRLNDFIRNSSYAKFDELAIEYINKYDSVWNKIAVLFELINRSVQIVSNNVFSTSNDLNQMLTMKLKEIAANYIHDKYCDWIYKNGGWKSVPDIISLPRENNERIH